MTTHGGLDLFDLVEASLRAITKDTRARERLVTSLIDEHNEVAREVLLLGKKVISRQLNSPKGERQ